MPHPRSKPCMLSIQVLFPRQQAQGAGLHCGLRLLPASRCPRTAHTQSRRCCRRPESRCFPKGNTTQKDQFDFSLLARNLIPQSVDHAARMFRKITGAVIWMGRMTCRCSTSPSNNHQWHWGYGLAALRFDADRRRPIFSKSLPCRGADGYFPGRRD